MQINGTTVNFAIVCVKIYDFLDNIKYHEIIISYRTISWAFFLSKTGRQVNMKTFNSKYNKRRYMKTKHF